MNAPTPAPTTTSTPPARPKSHTPNAPLFTPTFTATGAPHHPKYADIYFNRHNGAAEATYTYLGGNNLPARFAAQAPNTTFTLAELGFGTGLNFFLTAKIWQEQAPTSAHLHYHTFEADPLTPAALTQALAPWPELTQTETFTTFTNNYAPKLGCNHLPLANITLHLHVGDITHTLPTLPHRLTQKVNAWYLDGFAPAKNPTMWSNNVFNTMQHTSAQAATVATFTAARVAFNGLASAGFNPQKVKGYGYKRHMLVGQTESTTPC